MVRLGETAWCALVVLGLAACGGVTNGATGTPDPGGNAGAGGAAGGRGNAGGGAASGGRGGASSGGAMGSSGQACGTDFTTPDHCGTCDLNCMDWVSGAWGVKCVPPPEQELGRVSGTCDYDHCALGHVDLDGKRSNGCEYSCPYAVLGHEKDEGGAYCGADDDCDGLVDEDLCGPDACGACDKPCFLVPHRTTECLQSDITVTESSTAARTRRTPRTTSAARAAATSARASSAPRRA